MGKKQKNSNATAKKFGEVIDNWESIPLADGRFLDSLSGILAIQEPCAAVLEYQNTFFISYNSDPSKMTKTLLSEIFDLLNRDGSAQGILPYYLVFNTDFITSLSNEVNHASDLDDFGNQFEEYKSLTENIKNELRRGFYNTSDELANFYRSIKKQFLDADMEVAGEITEKFCVIEAMRDPAHRAEKLRTVADSYFKLVETLLTIDGHDALKSIIIRPLQDVEKTCYFIATSGLNVESFEVLDNPKKMHAEANLAKEFPFFNRGIAYIGVSKLCCHPCDVVLNTYNYAHRGTHGVFFPGWISPVRQFQELERKLQKSEDEKEQNDEVQVNDPVLQQLGRQLSYDDLETELGGFYKLKSGLGLLGIFDEANDPDIV